VTLSLSGVWTFRIGKNGKPKFLTSKLVKHLVLSTWAGFIFLALTGFYAGRVLPILNEWPKPWVLFWTETLCFVIVGIIPIFLLFRITTPSALPSKSKISKPLSLISSLTLLFFIFGFILGGYFWRLSGRIVLDHAIRDVKDAGLWPQADPGISLLPDSENALYYLQKAAEAPTEEFLNSNHPFSPYKSESDFIRQWYQDMEAEKISASDRAALIRLVQKHEDILVWVDEAYGKKANWHTIDLQRYSNCLNFARLLNFRAYRDARHGDGTAALKSIREALFLGDISRQNKSLISSMVDVGIVQNTFETFRAIFPFLTESQAGQDFFPFLNLETRKADYWKIFQVELLGLVGERGDPKFNPLPAVQEWIHPKFWISDTVFYALRHPHIWQYVPYLGRDAANEIFQWPFWNFGYASADEYKMEILKGFKLPYPQMTSAIEKANDEYQKKSWMFVGPYRFSMFLVKEDEAETYTNIAHAAFAARRYYQKHNHWPFTVKDLDGNQADYLDPYTDGEGLRIDAYPRGIVIYCQSPYYSNWSNFHPDFSKGYQRDFPAWILQSKQNSAGQEEVNEGVQAIRNKDYLHAMNSFQKAVALGNATGETDIGYLYQNGQGVPKDWVEALKWHKKAAEGGDAGAAYAVGLFYEFGWGCPKDDTEALKWYQRAAEQDNPIAQVKVGAFDEAGLIVPRDRSQAQNWFQRAAATGNPSVFLQIGGVYENGWEGVPKNIWEAKKWYQKAADQGYAEAQQKLAALNRPVPTPTPAPADQKTVKPAQPSLPSGAEAFVSAGTKINELKEVSLRGKGSRDLLVCFNSTAEVLGQDDGRWSLLFRRDFGEFVVYAGVYQPDPNNPTDFLYLENYVGASVGGGLTLYRWDGKDFKNAGSIHMWDTQLKDLDGNGKQEIVCRDRYGPDNILTCQKGEIVFANYDYPNYFSAKAKEIETRTNDPSLTDHEKLREEEYGDWLPVFLYAGRLQEGLRVVKKLRSCAENEDGYLADLLQREFDSFEADVLTLEGNDKAKIHKMHRQVPLIWA